MRRANAAPVDPVLIQKFDETLKMKRKRVVWQCVGQFTMEHATAYEFSAEILDIPAYWSEEHKLCVW